MINEFLKNLKFKIALQDYKLDEETKEIIPSLKPLQNQKYQEGDFVAIDFEIAFSSKELNARFPCQIGIAVVKDKKIVKTLSYLVKPPHNEWSQYLERWLKHNTNLSPEDTANAKEFNELWPEIKDYFEDQFIIAHNATSVEIDVLDKLFHYYDMPLPKIKGYLCTMKLFYNICCCRKLEYLCNNYGIEFNEQMHHDAEQDAIACAKLFIAFLNNTKPIHEESLDLFNINELEECIELPTVTFSKYLTGKRVVLTGNFTLTVDGKRTYFTHAMRDKILKPWIESMGCKVTGSISSKTDVVIQGENPGKQDKIQEQIDKGSLIKVYDMSILDEIIETSFEEESQTDIENPLYQRKFALIGKYTAEDERYIRNILRLSGAELNPKDKGKYNITRNTHYCIDFGNASEEELRQIKDCFFDGYPIMVLPVEDLEEFSKDDLGKYYTKKEIIRNLKITPEYLTDECFKIKAEGLNMNPYAGKEIYIGKGLHSNIDVFSQLIGNIGGYANREYVDKESQIILLSDKSVEHLLNGEYDETIDNIEKTYNKAKDSLGQFTCKIVTESEMLNWIKNWIIRFDIQDSTLNYYNQCK